MIDMYVCMYDQEVDQEDQQTSTLPLCAHSPIRPFALHVDMDCFSVLVIEFKRSPASLVACLAESPECRDCLESLLKAGYVHSVGKGAKMFLDAEQYGAVLHTLEKEGINFGDGELVAFKDLHRRHIVASARLGAEILKITGQIRSKYQVKPKQLAHVLIPMTL